MWSTRGNGRRIYRSRTFIVLLLMVGLSAVVLPAQAVTTEPPRRIMSGWLPYWTTAESTARVLKNADLFNEVSPFWFSAVTSGSTVSITSQTDAGTRSSIGAQLNGRGIKVLPTITDGTRPGVMATRLRNSKTRAALVTQLVALTDQPHVDGVDLDWENFAFRDGHASWSTTRPAWVAFITSLGAHLHKRHKLLAVTTPPLYDAGQANSSGYWVYDWSAIAGSIDRLRIMTYDYSFDAPGPIAPYAWVDRVAAFAVTQVPAGKVELGVAAYGRDWVARKADNSLDITGTCPVNSPPSLSSHEFPSSMVPSILSAHGLTSKNVRWDPVSQERTFRFVTGFSGLDAAHKPTSCRIVHEVWYDDVSSALSRSRLVYRYHLAGLAQWTVGGESMALWPKLRAYARAIAPKVTRITLRAPLNITYGAPLRLNLRAVSGGASVSGAPVTVRFMASGGHRWSVIRRARTSRTGAYVLPLAARRSGQYNVLIPGTYIRRAASAQVRVQVHSAVTIRLSENLIRSGQSVIAMVGVNPRIKGQRVLRQVLTGGRWVTAGTATTNASGVALFSFSPTAVGKTLRYRMMTSPVRGYAAGAVYFKVTVRR